MDQKTEMLVDEDRNDRFRRLAKARMVRLLKELDLIGNLAGPTYEFTREEVDAVFGSINRAVKQNQELFERRLAKGDGKKKPTFDF